MSDPAAQRRAGLNFRQDRHSRDEVPPPALYYDGDAMSPESRR
jgi:hypothetical protein